MGMDPWLASVYGTNGTSSDDLEKLAQAQMAQEMAQQEGVNLDGLTEEQIAQLGSEVLGQQPQQQHQAQPGAQQAQQQQQGAPQFQQPGAQQQQAQQQQMQQGQAPGQQQQGAPGQDQGQGQYELTPELVQEAQQILSQPEGFDPAIVQEAQAIMQLVQQQQAQAAGQPSPEMAKVAEANAKFEEADFLGRVMAHAFTQETEKIAASKQASMVNRVSGAAGVAKHHLGQAAGAVGQHMAQHPGHAAAAGAVGGAALGGAVGHHMNKQAAVNAIEKAAQAQAASILSQNGIDPSQFQAPAPPVAPQQQMAPAPQAAPAAGPQAALGELVEKRAHQILRSLGFEVK